MDIEEVAKKNPKSIITEPVDIKTGLTPEKAAKIVDRLDFANEKQRTQAIDQLQKLYKMFIAIDAIQVEINPWAVTPDDQVYCVDAKLLIDDSAAYRQKKYVDMQKSSLVSEDVDPNEEKAAAIGINYVGLDGKIGCMVNGAGLAMATMDIIDLKGAKPANFLDVGGSANASQVKAAFEILVSHPQVKAILVNIFGGIMRCDIIADGIIQACQSIKLQVPLVVRLTGTNAKEGMAMLDKFTKDSKGAFKIITADNLDEAATKVVVSLSN
jgi:succinyl-CoA synthetase beta subunit